MQESQYMMCGNDDFIKQMDALVSGDHLYQQILTELLNEEQNYLRIIKDLPEQDQEKIERYIALCEDLEYQRARLAYQCGKMCIK